VATITIRNLDEALKVRLRVRAASRGHSMEEEARHILRAALVEPSPAAPHLGERIRRRFAPLGDVQLAIAAREPVRDPPLAATVPETSAGSAAKMAHAAPRRRRA
jgi:antitoxin FitA